MAKEVEADTGVVYKTCGGKDTGGILFETGDECYVWAWRLPGCGAGIVLHTCAWTN